MDPNTSPDAAVAIPEGPDADTQTPTTIMDIDAGEDEGDIDAGEDEGLPRVGKFMYLIIVVTIHASGNLGKFHVRRLSTRLGTWKSSRTWTFYTPASLERLTYVDFSRLDVA
jgi:hypothetical protein